MKTAAIILSGGKGSRFGTQIPKQYLEVLGRPVLSYTLEAFEKSKVDEIVIVCAANYDEMCRDIACECGCKKVSRIVNGGAERYDSVLCGLEALRERLSNDDVVLIHDGARALITPDVINKVISVVEQHGAAIAAIPCTDTIKLVDEDGCITATTNRRLTWAAQTPQGFTYGSILNAYRQVVGENTMAVNRAQNVFNGLVNDREGSTMAVNNAQNVFSSFKDGRGEENQKNFEYQLFDLNDRQKLVAKKSDIDNEKNKKLLLNEREITDDAMVYSLVYPDAKVYIVQSETNNFKITHADDLQRMEAVLLMK